MYISIGKALKNISSQLVLVPTMLLEVHKFHRNWDLEYFKLKYCKMASSNTSRLEAHVGFFRLLMKGIFGPYVL